MRNVIIMPRARRQIDRAAAWWDDHRDKAPEAFDDDLAHGIAVIAENAATGTIVRRGRGTVRRILLQRIRYYPRRDDRSNFSVARITTRAASVSH
jgi:plasmid stabilization system protein ParE